MPWLASGGSPPETRCAAGLRNRRDILIAPPLHTAHYPGGAIGTSRPSAITHAIFARRIPTAAVCGSPPSRLALFTPAGAPGPVPCHLAGFGVQSRSMSAARLHSHRPWGLPTPPGFPVPWRLAYRLWRLAYRRWGLPTARAASSAGTFSRRKETSNRKNETPP